jgi:hypothetical protein
MRTFSSIGRAVLVAVAGMLLVAACSSDDDPAPLERSEVGCAATDFSVCGYPFDDLTDEVDRPAYTAPFAFALSRWTSEAMCQGVVARGRCADGKDLLFWKLGEATEVRYYDSEGRPIGVALLGTTSVCGDPCPRESFYGPLEALRCDEPEMGPLCGPFVRVDAGDLPFADGRPLNACEECSP